MPNLTRQGVKDAIRSSAYVPAEMAVTLADGTNVPFRVWDAEAQTRLGSLIGRAQAMDGATDQLGWDVLRTAIRLAVVDDQRRPIFDSDQLVGDWLVALCESERGKIMDAARWVLQQAGLAPEPEDEGADPDAGQDMVAVGKASSPPTVS